MNNEALKGHLELLLMSVLRDGPAHGYAIIEILRRRSAGTFDLPEGTIYPALHRLEADGLLASEWSQETGRRKRIYHLTGKGELALARRESEWRLFARAINSTLGG